MPGESLSLITLSMTIVVHLISTVWWAASLTRRVEHIEKWIAHHEHTAERLGKLEERIENVGAAVSRIEHFLRQKY